MAEDLGLDPSDVDGIAVIGLPEDLMANVDHNDTAAIMARLAEAYESSELN